MNTPALSELSILIVTWNGDDLLKNCLDSLARACGDVPEIVVVDNANMETTKALVAAYPNTKYIAAPENLGFAGGNNLGLPLCTRPYILLLNNDTIVHEEPFTQLIRYLKDHPKVAVVQGTMVLPYYQNTLDMCGGFITKLGIVYPRQLFHNPKASRRENRAVFLAKGAMLLFRTDILKLTGGLFYNHFKSNHEDDDFYHRVWLVGYEVHFVDTPPIEHLMNQTVKRMNRINFASQDLANTLFSWLTLLSIPVLIKTLFFHFTFILTIAVRHCVSLNFSDIRVIASAIKKSYENRRLIRETRRRIQSVRAVSDNAIFSNVGIKPGFKFYWKFARGALQDYDLSDK